jgi:hypothetical protein
MRLLPALIVAALLAGWLGSGGPSAVAQEAKGGIHAALLKGVEWTDAQIESTDPLKLFDPARPMRWARMCQKTRNWRLGCLRRRLGTGHGLPAALADFIRSRPRMRTGQSFGTRRPSRGETNCLILRWDRFTLMDSWCPAIIRLRAIIS